MKIETTLLFLFLGLAAFAQKESTVYINLVNTQDLNIEKRRFFDQMKSYSFKDRNDDQYFNEFNKGFTLPETPGFNVKKIDNNNYVLKLIIGQPEVVYVNFHPVYIVPGDSLKITFEQLLNTFDKRRDTIIAEGNHKCNYEYSNFLKAANLELNSPKLTMPKYQNDILLFYADVKKYYDSNNLYYQSIYGSKLCDQKLIDYIQRINNEIFLFDLIFYENDLRVENKGAQAKVIGDAIEQNFNSSKFVSADSVSFEMENLFKAYFKRSMNINFHQLASRADFLSCTSFIRNYSNLYIKQYFIYFFIANYSEKIKKYDSDAIAVLKKDITIPRMLYELNRLEL